MLDADTLGRTIEFHGHMCPDLTMGIRAAEVALGEVGPHTADEEMVAIVETDMCGVDVTPPPMARVLSSIDCDPEGNREPCL